MSLLFTYCTVVKRPDSIDKGRLMVRETFGSFAQKLRKKKSLGLREAARLMGLSPASLSQVERDIDVPTGRIMAAMSRHYDHPFAEIQAAAERAGVENRKPQTPKRAIEEVYALYRLGGGMFTSDEVEDMLRHVLKKRKMTDEQIEGELAKFRTELPRIRKAGGEGLFAADIKPRFLTKQKIAAMAYRILQRNGWEPNNYVPPTRIESLVENEEGISYIIDELPSTDGDPVVLGRSRWNGPAREITINNDLANSDKECDRHRFRFTLGHEFFHAIEHLPLATAFPGQLPRTANYEIGLIDRAPRRRSQAERAVDRWANRGSPRGLLTPEDWREWQANAFASAILMPEWAVKDEFRRRVGVEYVPVREGENSRESALEIAGEIFFCDEVLAQSLAQLFDVSRQAMAIRLFDLELVREVGSQ